MTDLDDLALLLAEGLDDDIELQGRTIDPEGYDSDGNMILDPEALDWAPLDVEDMDVCDHESTICGGCVTSWALDWEFRLVEV